MKTHIPYVPYVPTHLHLLGAQECLLGMRVWDLGFRPMAQKLGVPLKGDIGVMQGLGFRVSEN